MCGGFRLTSSVVNWSLAPGHLMAGCWTSRWRRQMCQDTWPTESGTFWVRPVCWGLGRPTVLPSNRAYTTANAFCSLVNISFNKNTIQQNSTVQTTVIIPPCRHHHWFSWKQIFPHSTSAVFNNIFFWCWSCVRSSSNASHFTPSPFSAAPGVPGGRHEVFYDCCPQPYPDVTFVVTLRRRTLFYALNLLVPCVLLSSMTLVCFLLPANSGEKISLGEERCEKGGKEQGWEDDV